MKLILTLLLLCSLKGHSQALFKPGLAYAKGIHVTDLNGVVWSVKYAGTYQMITTTYFTFVRYGFSPIENLFSRVEALEAKSVLASPDLKALTARVTALESRPTGGTIDLTGLLLRLTALEKPMYIRGTGVTQRGDTIIINR